jgi:hypothetical protein
MPQIKQAYSVTQTVVLHVAVFLALRLSSSRSLRLDRPAGVASRWLRQPRPGLDEQVRDDLQREIQAVLDQMLQRAKSAQPAAGTEPPSKEQIREQVEAARAQLSSPPAPALQPRQHPPRNGGIHVVTNGLKLAPEDRRTFNSEVRQLVQERLTGMSPDLGGQSVTVCGCNWPFGGCCWPPAGQLADLTQIDPLPFPARQDEPITIALYLQAVPGAAIDSIQFQIWIDPRWALWPPDQILVGLRIDPTLDPDQWAKEVTGWTICQCTVQTDHVENTPPNNYNWMLINQATVDTLAFRKAVFLSWANSGYFGPTPAEFWNLLGGFTLTFDWVSDGSNI